MEKGKKRSKAGLWLIVFGVLAIPAIIVGSTMGANEGGGTYQMPPSQLMSYIVICAVLIGIGVVINIRQTRKERKEETATDDSTTTE